jgi:uncharacterized UBP type Zn finger protein
MYRAKLASGILSGRYSKPVDGDAENYQQGIKPTMFKSLIGKGHPEFSTKRQQDAMEFLLHLINVTEVGPIISKLYNLNDVAQFVFLSIAPHPYSSDVNDEPS